jgi:hypothetical protein
MPARLYNAAYRVWPATFASSHLPQSTSPPRPLTSSSSSNGGVPFRRGRRGEQRLRPEIAAPVGGTTPAPVGGMTPASTPRTMKQEPATAPRRNSGALVIREGGARTASPPRRCKAKKDAGAKAASDLAEEAATEEAIQRSLRDVVPAENTMPLDAVLEWSRREWEGAGGAGAAAATAGPGRRTASRRCRHATSTRRTAGRQAGGV